MAVLVSAEGNGNSSGRYEIDLRVLAQTGKSGFLNGTMRDGCGNSCGDDE